ncbi:hypothetical protein AVEN_193073-1 [Araneus ventricosus]|uniref:Uncharacterized protein n=1 Tax=Araneus ventricosus TaxID=182803 RepID=A0A4Y2AZT3_ARAVE|nr:hypothetical protein AVEN_193073-1 [Araneus ventricosus]
MSNGKSSRNLESGPMVSPSRNLENVQMVVQQETLKNGDLQEKKFKGHGPRVKVSGIESKELKFPKHNPPVKIPEFWPVVDYVYT